ncbi:MAG: hydroxyacylglutathione hydrolase [Paucibacter sp.]|nr:hydroxyacylglutathione hydrolase [Roseateles sp.]
MNLTPLPAFADNYIWMLDNGREALVVDPGDAAPVLQALGERSLSLAGILVTHHHSDHVGGLAELRPHLRGAVYGPARENIPAPYEPLVAGDEATLLGLRFKVIEVPGHTAGHIAYFHASTEVAPLLFCGDTLFSAGCGRLFEGTPEQMHASLATLAALPGETRVCCAHEYTLANLRFARHVEPGNAALRAHEAWARMQRERELPTLPSTIAVERAINPFLRAHEPEVARSAHGHQSETPPDNPVAVFATLRQWKNEFK